jgi:uncharacterized beta-barrel protein YwiB (DUF1934 family)
MEFKDVIISITGSQQFSDEYIDSIELITSGQYCFNDGECRLTYMESDLTGLDGTQTSFTVEPFGVTMLREGTLNSRMVFEEGKKHYFLYETPFGSSTMGVDTHRIDMQLGENGGDMEIDYAIDFDNSFVGKNKFIIKVYDQKDGTPWQI